MLQVRNLSFSYKNGNSRYPVFEDLNIEFSRGLNVVLGPNGAGKTTLLKSIFGLLKYDGTVCYGKENLTAMSTGEKTRRMAYLPQMDIETSMLTVLEMVLLGRLPELGHRISDEDLSVVMQTLDALKITSLADRNFGQLSGGQKRLVFVAQTLVRQPEIILLDEPVNSLDLQKQLELCGLLRKIVRNRNVDIIMILHDINLAVRHAEHLVVIDGNGKHYSSGSPARVVTPDMLRDVYGVIAEIGSHGDGIPVVSPIRSVRDA